MKLLSQNSRVKVELIEFTDVGREIKDFGIVSNLDVFKRIYTYEDQDNSVLFPASKNYKEE